MDRLARLGIETGSGAGIERGSAVGPGSAPSPADPVAAAARIGWAALAWLPGPANVRRATVDERRLTWPLAGAFAARDLSAEAARDAAARARFLVGVPLPGEIGRPAETATARAAALVDAWLDDPELRAVIGHHDWEGVDYVSAEGWAALATTTSELAVLASHSRAAVRAAAAIAPRLISVARDAGYRVEAIRAALAAQAPPESAGRTARRAEGGEAAARRGAKADR